MLRMEEVSLALALQVGWRQPFEVWGENPDGYLLEIDQPLSGLYFNDAHPLMTYDNIRAIMPENWLDRYIEWKATDTYGDGAIVKYNGKTYRSTMSPNVNHKPDTLAGWEKYNQLNDFLRQITYAGVTQVVNTFLNMKSLNKETKNLLERRLFFDGAGRINATLKNTGKLVGFEITPIRALGVTAKIERIGLQMTGATGPVTVYLFHSDRVEPVAAWTINVTKGNGTFVWIDLWDEGYLPYIDTFDNENQNQTSGGGSWYLVYNQNDLPQGMQAINFSKDWSREPCGTCNQGSLETYRELTKYLQVSPFQTHAYEDFKQYPELWDAQDMAYTNTQNYGLNVEISVGCDLSDFIIKQAPQFAIVVQKQVAYNVLRTMAMNPEVRVNRNQSNVDRMNILYELDGNTNSNRPSGLGYELKKAYEALSLDTRGIDRICLTCNNGGVKYRTV